MKTIPHSRRSLLLALMGLALASPAPAQEEAAPTPGPKVVVLLPERIDVDWYWYHYTQESQHKVQSAVEKALINAHYTVIDVTALPPTEDQSVQAILNTTTALGVARELGAEWLILGQGEAILASRNHAYGLHVVRSTAEVTAKLIRVKDGTVVAAEEVTHTEGGEAQKAAGRKALGIAGKQMGKRLVSALAATMD